jgi:ATP-dependent exoDNAse (exonuclease V) beta subunit
MDDTDFDFLCEGVSADEAKRLRKILKQWCDGDENSFPVQLALLTRAQWYAAAQTPVLLKQSLELLGRKLDDYRQQTATLLRSFNSTTDTKAKELEKIVANHREAASAILADLQEHTATAKTVVNQIQDELRNGARDLKKIQDDAVAERKRMEKARTDYESRKDAMDWVVFIMLLLAMIAIGVFIGWKWH